MNCSAKALIYSYMGCPTWAVIYDSRKKKQRNNNGFYDSSNIEGKK